MCKPNNKSGIAAPIVISLLVLLYLGVGALTYVIITSSGKTNRYLHKQRAIDLGQAGTQDALFWFRRQPTLPVALFDPKSPDSENPSRGLQRTVVIDERNIVKGVYLVEKTLTKDLTSSRGEIGAGWIWEISSRGVVYRELSNTVPFDQAPNVIIEDVRVTTEIRMLHISPEVYAAIVVDEGKNVTCGSKAQVLGGNSGTGIIGICYKRNGSVVIQSGADVRGDPQTKAFSSLKLTCRDVFGIDQSTLRNLSDYVTEEGADGLPLNLPDFCLIYSLGDINFSAAHPLNGGGILFVDGNLTFATGSNSTFTGVVFVTGKITLNTPCWIEGQVIAVKGGTIGSTGYDKALVMFNKDVLNLISQLIGNYRKKRSYTVEVL